MGRVTPIQVLALFSLLSIFPNLAHAQFKQNYYANICPNVETIVRNTVTANVRQSFVTIPGTLRLFFHDCFVHGCDASVMIASSGSNTYPGAHTLGFYHCDQFTNRIYNFSKQNPVDPTLSPSYAAQLQQQCPKNVDSWIALTRFSSLTRGQNRRRPHGPPAHKLSAMHLLQP